MRTNLWDNDPCDRHGNPMCTVCTLIRLHDKIDRQSSLLREAREALEKYGEHDSKCDGINCFCGLNNAIDKLEGLK